MHSFTERLYLLKTLPAFFKKPPQLSLNAIKLALIYDSTLTAEVVKRNPQLTDLLCVIANAR